MAHFAELDEKNIVKRVIVVDNINCVDPSIKMSYPVLTQSILKSVSGKIVSMDKAGTVKKENVSWEDEAVGITYCQKIFGKDTMWKQTSYNGNIRKNYAGIGFTYDKNRDAFIPPQPYKSWILNEIICQWEAPIKFPDDGKMYNWNEDKQIWEVME